MHESFDYIVSCFLHYTLMQDAFNLLTPEVAKIFVIILCLRIRNKLDFSLYEYKTLRGASLLKASSGEGDNSL